MNNLSQVKIASRRTIRCSRMFILIQATNSCLLRVLQQSGCKKRHWMSCYVVSFVVVSIFLVFSLPILTLHCKSGKQAASALSYSRFFIVISFLFSYLYCYISLLCFTIYFCVWIILNVNQKQKDCKGYKWNVDNDFSFPYFFILFIPLLLSTATTINKLSIE